MRGKFPVTERLIGRSHYGTLQGLAGIAKVQGSLLQLLNFQVDKLETIRSMLAGDELGSLLPKASKSLLLLELETKRPMKFLTASSWRGATRPQEAGLSELWVGSNCFR